VIYLDDLTFDKVSHCWLVRNSLAYSRASLDKPSAQLFLLL
jgi:hypothetical protein